MSSTWNTISTIQKILRAIPRQTLFFSIHCKLAMLSNVLLKQASRRSAAAAAAVMTGRRGFAKEIKFGVEGRAAMLRGVDVLADAVQVRNKCVCRRRCW
jgi:hypothetical protein